MEKIIKKLREEGTIQKSELKKLLGVESIWEYTIIQNGKIKNYVNAETALIDQDIDFLPKGFYDCIDLLEKIVDSGVLTSIEWHGDDVELDLSMEDVEAIIEKNKENINLKELKFKGLFDEEIEYDGEMHVIVDYENNVIFTNDVTETLFDEYIRINEVEDYLIELLDVDKVANKSKKSYKVYDLKTKQDIEYFVKGNKESIVE
ncbi:MAG: hypothetical protein ACRC4M_02035 [Mycoplasma sp.]